jgi:hypothetical protein
LNSANDIKAQRVELIVAAALSAVLVALHLVLLYHAGPLWRDEISSLSLATKPTLGEAWATLAYDPFPVLFFSILRVWHFLFGDSDLALRTLGTCIGISCIAAFWITARLTGNRAPSLTLVLLGFSPIMIIWGDSLRAYGLGVFWIVIAFGCFWRVVERPNFVTIAATTVAAVLSVQALFTNALLIFACGSAAAIVAARRRQWKRSALALGIGGVAALSLLPYTSTVGATKEWAELRSFPLPLHAFWSAFRDALSGAGHPGFWLWVILALAAVLAALWFQRRNSGAFSARRDISCYALISGVVGCAATLIFFRMLGWPTNVWYYLSCMAVAAISIDLLLGSASFGRQASLLRPLVATGCVVLSFAHLFASLQMRASNLDLVARSIARQAGPNDLIVLHPFTDAITLQRYLHRPIKWVTIPNIADVTLHRWDQVVEQARRPEAIQPVVDEIHRRLHEGNNVWLVSTFPLYTSAERPAAVLPLGDSEKRYLGSFLHGWGRIVIYELQREAARTYAVAIPSDQPISPYEQARVFMFSSAKDSASR